ncbi:MAG: hypothetical protein AABO41_00160 [Acidobacteriota bacterium]
MGSLGSIGLLLVVSILATSTQIAMYGFPVKLLVSLVLALGVAVGSRYAIRKRNGTVTKWDCSWWIGGLAVAAVFLLANQLIVRGIAVGIWDAEGELFPFQVVVADFVRSGRFVHWDPWSDAGLPLASDPSVGAFSPLNLAVGLLTGGTSLGFRIYWLFVWSLGGFGILMLARQLKAPAWGGAVVAVGFLFCGVYTGNAEHTSCVVAFSFVPLIIWRLDRALVSRTPWPAAEAGALWGLSALSGYPAQTIITGFFCVLWAVGRLAFPEGSKGNDTSVGEISSAPYAMRARFLFLLAVLAIVLVVGLAVLSPTYYTFFAEGAGTTARSGPLSRDVAILSNALHPGALSTLASPYLAALKADNQLQGNAQMWPGIDLSMCSIYSGGIVVVFALLSILARPRDRWRLWLVVLAGFSLACAVGGWLPLRGWLYDWIYPTRFFRHPALFGLYFVFTISAMALVGTSDLQAAIRNGGASPVWRRFKIASIVCATSALAAFLAVVGSFGAERSISFRQAPGMWLIVSGVWLAILGLAMLSGSWPDSVRLSYLPAILLAIAAGDAVLTNAVSQANMVSTDPKDVARWQSLDARHSAIIDLNANGLMREENPCVSSNIAEARPRANPHAAVPCPFSDQLITKIPVLESYSTLSNPFLLRTARHPILKETAIGNERIWFAADALQVPATEDFFSAFERRAEALHAPPLVIHSLNDLTRPTGEAGKSRNRTDDLARIAELPACDRIQVRVAKYDPEELAFNCNCPADGWLLVTDRWGPSWRGEVNNQPTEVYGANFIFRAIRVRAGENSIRFTYHPPLFPWLLILSWTTLGGIVVWSVFRAVKQIKN